MIRKKKKQIKRSDDLIEFSPTGARTTISFYERVYAVVCQIPRGRVTTYGAIAELLGTKSSSRLVGQALRSMPPDRVIPAQRVLNRNGLLTGAHGFGGYERMRWILEGEGITFKGEAADLDKHFWDPRKSEA